jgi:hypothetical protein
MGHQGHIPKPKYKYAAAIMSLLGFLFTRFGGAALSFATSRTGISVIGIAVLIGIIGTMGYALRSSWQDVASQKARADFAVAAAEAAETQRKRVDRELTQWKVSTDSIQAKADSLRQRIKQLEAQHDETRQWAASQLPSDVVSELRNWSSSNSPSKLPTATSSK